MIAAWMLYCVGIGLAFVVAGRAIEWALHLAGRQTRWAWGVALAGTLLVPVAAWLVPGAFSSVTVPIPQVAVPEPASVPPSVPAPEATLLSPQPARAFSLGDLDGALRWGWGLSSVALLLVLAAAALRLAVLRRRWRAALVDGRTVLVSENVGPAVTGLWRSWIVVPDWALQLTERQRELMLAHEEEHVRAGDPRLLAAGALALALAPWNPALWWQLRRLRLAVEMDCDARVLRRAGQTPEYGELLLQVGRRRAQVALGAAALGEPISFLEHRIRRMATALPRWRWLGAGAGFAVAAGAVIGACEAPRPAEPVQAAGAIAQSVRERVDSAMAEHLGPWIRENLERYYPDLLREPSGPPVDVWLGHDARGHVAQAARLSGNARDVTSQRIQAVFRSFRAGHDGWSVVDRRALKGLVRDNVRIIKVHLGALNRDLSAFDEHPEVLVLPWVLDGITRHYPGLLKERTGPRLDLWFVADSRKQILRTLQRPGPDTIRVGIAEIHGVFPDVNASNVAAWSLHYGPGLGRLVRDNVRVIWIQLRDTPSPSPVEERPAVLAGPALPYPELLRHAGIQGQVIVQAIIDTSGRAEPQSVKVIRSPHPGFDESARNYVLRALFRPARVDGHPVRALLSVPIDFKM